jgi:hypothetical protein
MASGIAPSAATAGREASSPAGTPRIVRGGPFDVKGWQAGGLTRNACGEPLQVNDGLRVYTDALTRSREHSDADD